MSRVQGRRHRVADALPLANVSSALRCLFEYGPALNHIDDHQNARPGDIAVVIPECCCVALIVLKNRHHAIHP